MNPHTMWRLPLNRRHSHGFHGAPRLPHGPRSYSAVSFFLFSPLSSSSRTQQVVLWRGCHSLRMESAGGPLRLSILALVRRSTNLWTWDRRFRAGTCCFPCSRTLQIVNSTTECTFGAFDNWRMHWVAFLEKGILCIIIDRLESSSDRDRTSVYNVKPTEPSQPDVIDYQRRRSTFLNDV